MSKKSAIQVQAAIAVVPQWTVANSSLTARFRIAGQWGEIGVACGRDPQERLATFRDIVERDLRELSELCEALPVAMARQFVQHKLVVAWLLDQAPHVEWEKLISYVEELGERTYENDPVGCNLIVAPPDTVADSEAVITDPEHQKVLDPLAASPFSYLRVTGDLKFIGYEQIGWDDVRDEERSELYPGFLRPIALALDPYEFCVVRTLRGDVIVLDEDGLIATKRKGRWRIYEPKEFQYTLLESLKGSFTLAQNIFEIAFELSFRRHGALLVYDPEEIVVGKLANAQESVLLGDHTGGDSCRRMLSPALSNIALGSTDARARKRRLLAEVASMDGAILFSEDRILAVGAMIEPHFLAKTEKGARSTAALSAYYHGGRAIKISADGDVTLYYGSPPDPPQNLKFL